MEGEIVNELEVSAAASAVWEIYGSLEISKLCFELLSAEYKILGDGGVGTILEEIMEGEIVNELEVSAAASAVWEIYGSLEISKLCFELLSAEYKILGDGGVGTILEGWLPHNVYAKEKIIKIDNEKYLREVETVEGGLLDKGFSLNRFRFEISEKEANSCIIKSIVEYKAYNEAEVSFTIMQSEHLELLAATVAKRLSKKKEQTH